MHCTKQDNCNIYGGLYTWDEMMDYVTAPGDTGICPQGWHIPTDVEWKILEGTVDSQYDIGNGEWDLTAWRGYDAGKNLKSISGWSSSANGLDFYGFSGLLQEEALHISALLELMKFIVAARVMAGAVRCVV